MGHWACTRRAPLGNQTPITPSNIYFLDNRFHPLATSQKVCDAWRKQSEQMASWRSSVRWLMHVRMRVSASSSWRRSSNATSHLWRVSKAASVVSTWWNLQFWRGSLALTKMKSCRLSKPPRSPTTRFENKEFWGAPYWTFSCEVSSFKEEYQPTSTNCVMLCRRGLETRCRDCSAIVQEVSKQWTMIKVKASRSPI